jgi:hypothetical protein
MALYNLCRGCGHRISKPIRKCGLCGSLSNTQFTRKILSGVFAITGVLLIVLISRMLS